MEKQKKSVGTIALVILLLIVTVISLVLATYAWAKYTTTRTSEATATVARWNVSFEPGNDTFTGTYSHVVATKIAPGTTGTFSVQPIPSTTEVCFNYTIVLDKLEFIDTNGTALPDSTVLDNNGTENDPSDDITLGQFRTHIKFTNEAGTDVTPSTSVTNNVQTDVAGNVTSGTYELSSSHKGSSGTLTTTNAQGEEEDGIETFTWTWEYEPASLSDAQKEVYNKVDTAAGKYSEDHKSGNVNGLRMKVTYTATAVQVTPNAANH